MSCLLLLSIMAIHLRLCIRTFFHFKSESHSVMSNSLWQLGQYSPWNSPGQSTGVGSLSLLPGIFPTQGSNPGLHIAGGFFTSWAKREAPSSLRLNNILLYLIHHFLFVLFCFVLFYPVTETWIKMHVFKWMKKNSLDYREIKNGWALKNWCFWTVVLEKTPESPLDCKEIHPVHPKGNQS